MTYNRISYEIRDQIAKVGFGLNSKKSMTVLDEETLTELKAIVEDLKSKDKAKELKGVLFFSNLPNVFIAGADINLISSLKNQSEGANGAQQGQNILNDIEDLSIPTIACVDGPCMGGGLELALSCKTILASQSSKTIFALPEVKLGLIPGFGGTFRLPKKVGLPNSLDMILTGKNVRAKKAKKIGLAKEVYPTERLLEMAITKHMKVNKNKFSVEKVVVNNVVTRKFIFQQARKAVLKKTKGFYQAPLKILDVMENGIGKKRSSYLQKEAEAFGELCVSLQSKNLQHIFFMMESSKKYDGPECNTEARELKRGACLGAGTMGGGIAWLMADTGMFPLMKDINKEALELGIKQSSTIFSKAVKKKRLSFDDFNRKQRSISPQTDYNGFSNMDLIIEAIVENIDIKKKVFSELETNVRKDTLITSNTSSLSITEMSKALTKPDRFLGLHFFNPVNMMPLVEIITHPNASAEGIKALHNWCLKAKKTPVIVNDGPGFLVNRILAPFLNESVHLLEEGISIQDLDKACLNFGMPMGPCRLMDEVGLDVSVKVGKILYDALGDRMRPGSCVVGMVEKGLLGKKSKAGFYLYDEKEKSTGVNPAAQGFLPNKNKKLSEVEIQKRVFLPMINEASYVLSDKIVNGAMNVDLGLIFGIGFPPFRGGLLRYADHEGLDKILKGLEEFATSVDAARYNPSPYLKDLVNKNKNFYDA